MLFPCVSFDKPIFQSPICCLLIAILFSRFPFWPGLTIKHITVGIKMISGMIVSAGFGKINANIAATVIKSKIVTYFIFISLTYLFFVYTVTYL